MADRCEKKKRKNTIEAIVGGHITWLYYIYIYNNPKYNNKFIVF